MNPPPPYLDVSDWLKAAWQRPLLPLVEKLAGVRALNQIPLNLTPSDDSTAAFAEAALVKMGISWQLDRGDPPKANAGRGTLVLANHPTGIIEALILMRLLDRISPGNWKLLTNRWVAGKTEFSAHAIPLDPFAWDTDATLNLRSLRKASKVLRNGVVVGAFPSGRVAAKIDACGRAIDEPWSEHLVRIARSNGARILLAHIPLAPGFLMRTVPLRFPMLRSLLIPREALRRRPETLLVRLIPAPAHLPDDPAEAARLLHQLCHESPATATD